MESGAFDLNACSDARHRAAPPRIPLTQHPNYKCAPRRVYSVNG